MNARTAIVLLNWRGWQDTIACLDSLGTLQHDAFAVIVVDNASADESVKEITAHCAKRGRSERQGLRLCEELSQSNISGFKRQLHHHEIVLIQSDTNGGFAAGNNLGLRVALQGGCQNMWILNNDTTVDPQALTALERRLAASPDIGMVGSVLHYFDPPHPIQAIGGVQFNLWRARGKQLGQGLPANAPEIAMHAKTPLTYVAGASMLVPRAFLDDIGLMEEGYFLYFEEIDWAFRSKGRWKTATAVDSHIYHKEGGSIGTASRTRRSELSQYYLNRNLVRFYVRHCPYQLIFAVLNGILEVVKLQAIGESKLASCTAVALVHGLLGRSGKRCS